MKLLHTVIIAIAIIIGFVLFGFIKSSPEREKIRRGYEMQVRMLEMEPREIRIDGNSLMYLPRVSYQGLSIDVDYEFYKYTDNKLVLVPISRQ